MRTLRSILLCVIAITLAGVATDLVHAQRGTRWITYDQAFAARDRVAAADRVLGELPTIQRWLDDDRYLEVKTDGDGNQRIYVVNAADGRAEVYRDLTALGKDLPKGVDPAKPAATSPDGSRLVFVGDGDLYLYDTALGKPRRLTATPSSERNPRFSPDGKWIAYTRDNNLFAYDLVNGVEHQFTTDGSSTVSNGWASWVYYEEILERASQYAAFWWSPDSSRLAFMRFDDSPVPQFPIYHSPGQHGELELQRYPKAGDPNPYVQMGVVAVSDGKLTWMDFDPKADHYLAWPFWSADSKTLVVQWMNRGQDTIRFIACDAATGKGQPFFEQKQDSWVNFFEDIHVFSDGSGFLLRSDVDGWDHLYVYGMDGKLKRRLTSGAWRVASIARVDERGGWVYFVARPEKATWDTQLMRVKLDGTGVQQLTKDAGSHTVNVSPGGRYVIDTFSAIGTMTQMVLMRADGTTVRKLGDARPAAADQYAWGKAELFTIPSGDGYDLPASWVLPPDFNPKQRYPVIFSIYGGPDAGTVRDAFPGVTSHYWAERGVITISVDHRGSGHFGKKGVALMHRNLGKWEMHDLIAAADWLRTKPFVAADKIAITGGSYGGYVTMMALTFGAGKFNYGDAGSGVSDWKLYDSVYTERYMDKPDENPEGYRDGAVLTYVDRYKGGLLITHGTIDDNVHMQNSLQVIDWLTTHDQPFEMMLYPGSRHGIQPTQRPHYNRETSDFWVRVLLNGRMPQAPVVKASSKGTK